jgi:hypothetical protein
MRQAQNSNAAVTFTLLRPPRKLLNASRNFSVSSGDHRSTTQNTAPYTEGRVWQITMVKTKSGVSDDYLKALARYSNRQ